MAKIPNHLRARLKSANSLALVAVPNAPLSLNRDTEAIAIKFLEKKRGRGLYSPEKALGKCLSGFENKGKSGNNKSLQALKGNWTNIVGEKLAALCTPEAIKGKSLVLRAIGAATPLLQMRNREILGLASLASGVNFTKISFIQAKLEKPQKNRAFTPLDAAQSNEVENRIANIQSDRLKNAIRMLNTAINNLPK